MSLTKSFQKLKISDHSDASESKYAGNHPIASNPSWAPPRLKEIGHTRAMLPLPPDDWSTSRRYYYYYGWRLSSQWLMTFGEINAGGRKRFSPILDAFDLLRSLSGYRHIEYVTSMKDGVPLAMDDTDCPYHEAIAIAIATRKRPYCNWIPTQEQIDYLSQIFGSPPYWYLDSLYKKHIGDYALGNDLDSNLGEAMSVPRKYQ